MQPWRGQTQGTLRKLLCFFCLLPLWACAQVRIDATSFGAPEREIRAVLNSVIEVFPDENPTPLFITHSAKGPITLYEKNMRGETVIQLSAKGTYWAQYIYQFAHELAHVRAKFRPHNPANRWFEETLCESASLFALRQLSIKWRDSPPFPQWKNYRHHLHDYAQKVIHSREELTLKQLADFYQKHEAALRASSTQRPLNGAMANALLPLFEEAPERWRSLEFLNKTHFKKDITFATHLSAWQSSCAYDERAFVTMLIGYFQQTP